MRNARRSPPRVIASIPAVKAPAPRPDAADDFGELEGGERQVVWREAALEFVRAPPAPPVRTAPAASAQTLILRRHPPHLF